MDARRHVVSLDARAESLYGVTSADAAGWELARLIGTPAEELTRRLLDDARVLGQRFSRRSTVHVRPDGREVPVAVHAAADSDIGLLLVVDRTEPQQQLAELEVQALRLGQLETLTRSGLWGWHLANGTLEWSPGMFHLHAIPPQRFEGTIGWYLDLVDARDHAELLDAAHRAMRGDETTETTVGVVIGTGEQRWLRMAIDKASEDAVVATATDVTEARETIAELGRLNEGLDRVAFTMAHDVQSPMASVLGFAQLIRRHDDLPEDVQLYTDRIIASTRRTIDFVKEVLHTARQAAHRQAATELTPCVDWALSMLRPQVEEIDATIDVGEDLPTLPCRQATLRQLVLNLLSNSLKFADPARPCRITIRGGITPGGGPWATFADNGRGIPAGQRDRVFTRGFRADNVDDVAGTGLGLSASVAGIVEAGGRVDVEDPPDGAGVMFRLAFPARLHR